MSHHYLVEANNHNCSARRSHLSTAPLLMLVLLKANVRLWMAKEAKRSFAYYSAYYSAYFDAF
jgi:hypothetical protein